jgi:hypothetical protein
MADFLTPRNMKRIDDSPELIRHIENLFVGRPDVIAKRWENKKGESGYSPICRNEWKENICKKKTSNGSCNTCQNIDYVRIDHELIKKHINGNVILGTYPIHQDERVTSAAVDFDDHQGNKNPLADVSKLYSACQERGLTLYVLRSKSGTGYHAYLFFIDPVRAHDARLLVLELLRAAKINKDDFQSNSHARRGHNEG